MGERRSRGFAPVWNILLLVLVPLGIGILLAPQLVPRPAVGLIRLETDIWAGSAALVQAQIDKAREDPQIRAVVLVINSPGGEVAPTQSMYLELLELRRQMPVVASIDGVAASGGFYIAMAADPIYSRPSSILGNVGVWSFAPLNIGVNELILASGPFKLTGSNEEAFVREIEAIKQEFLTTVFTQRADRITITPSELSQGLTYLGREARELGLIDHLGGQQAAVDTAAEMAKIRDYEVIDLWEWVLEEHLESGAARLGEWVAAADPATGRRTLPPGAYLLYDMRLRGVP